MSWITSLNHVHKKTPHWIDVFVLDNWAVISSEAEAMIQALHSRSTGGFLNHLETLSAKWADDFMSKFYVWYGHKSIGDCWSITLFIEGVSMLWAKAIQDTKLYNWQEASTRYIDFSKQPMINPLGTQQGTDLLEKQRAFYLTLLEPLKVYIAENFPNDWSVSDKVYQKTVNAKAFDICRWFLPAWCSTNLAWHTTLRQVADRILVLRHHPLAEIRETAEAVLEAVLEHYPSSFSDKRYEATDEYIASYQKDYYHHNPNCKNFAIIDDKLDQAVLETMKATINARPNGKTELPTYTDMIWTITCEFSLDYWSFRDVQRHRAPYQRMPLLTTDLGFHDWYLTSLSPALKQQAEHFLKEIQDDLSKLNCSQEDLQYYIPMGFQIANQMMGTLPALTYMAELRSTTYVHPTLREKAIALGQYIRDTHGIKMFIDESPDDFDTRRWNHDIEIK